MVRKMAYIGFSYFIGLFFASFFYSEAFFVAGVVTFVLATIFAVVFRKKRLKIAVCIVAFSVGAIFYSLYSKNVYEKIVQFDETNVIVSGKITDYEDYSGDITGYTVDGKIGDISLKILCYGKSYNCQIGDEIHVKGEVSVPVNDFTFRAYDYYKSNGIYLTMDRAEAVKIVPSNAFSIKRELRKYREYIFSVFNEHLSTEEAAVVSAMFLGDKSELSNTVLTKMYRSGIGHIMAVSGAHLTIICSILWVIILLFPVSKRTAFLIMLVPMGCFVILSGASNSVLRAAIMLILVYSANLFGRRADLLNSLGISAIVITLSCPFAVRNPSLLLSITGVIAIGVISPFIVKMIREKHRVNFIVHGFITTAVASIMIFPMTILFFDETSVISPITNLLIISICTVIIVIALLVTITAGVSIIATPLLFIAGILCKIILAVTDLFGSIQIAFIPLGYDFILYVILISVLAIVISIIEIKSVKHRIIVAISMFSFCILAVAVFRYLPSDDISVAVICDNKRACTIIVHDKKNASVIDVSADKSNVYLAKRYLCKYGISRIEMVLFADDFYSLEAAYRENFALFEVGSVVIPAKNSLSSYKSSFGEKTFSYNEKNGAAISLDDVLVDISSEKLVEISAKNSKLAVISYDGVFDGNYTSVIFDRKYNPEKHGELSSDFWIFTDDDYLGENADKTAENVVVSEAVVMKITDEKIRMEKLNYGFDFK